MNLTNGTFIQSTEALNDTVFSNALLYVYEVNDSGAIAFIVNQRFGRSLHELMEFNSSVPFELYRGGPVDTEHLFFLHKHPDIIEESVHVKDGIYTGGNFAAAVRAINKRNIDSTGVKIFVGYCGWDAGELEGEIKEGSWKIVERPNSAVFQL